MVKTLHFYRVKHKMSAGCDNLQLQTFINWPIIGVINNFAMLFFMYLIWRHGLTTKYSYVCHRNTATLFAKEAGEHSTWCEFNSNHRNRQRMRTGLWITYQSAFCLACSKKSAILDLLLMQKALDQTKCFATVQTKTCLEICYLNLWRQNVYTKKRLKYAFYAYYIFLWFKHSVESHNQVYPGLPYLPLQLAKHLLGQSRWSILEHQTLEVSLPILFQHHRNLPQHMSCLPTWRL